MEIEKFQAVTLHCPLLVVEGDPPGHQRADPVVASADNRGHHALDADAREEDGEPPALLWSDVSLSRQFQDYFNLLMPGAAGEIQAAQNKRFVQGEDGGPFE